MNFFSFFNSEHRTAHLEHGFTFLLIFYFPWEYNIADSGTGQRKTGADFETDGKFNACIATGQQGPSAVAWKIKKEDKMEWGAFSVSLSVKDIAASRVFYEKLGFSKFAGNEDENWLILRNGEHVIGLFQGMFEKNILTFNPGWNQNGEPLQSFRDVRELQRELKTKGVMFDSEADENSTGPASFMISDPDGNVILVDQHV